MDALAQDAAQQRLALQDEDIVYAFFFQAQGRGQARGSAAYNDCLPVRHASTPPLT